MKKQFILLKFHSDLQSLSTAIFELRTGEQMVLLKYHFCSGLRVFCLIAKIACVC